MDPGSRLPPMCLAANGTVLFLLCGAAWGAGEGVDTRCRQGAERLLGHAMSLENAWYRAVVRENKDAAPEWIEVNLTKAVMANDLRVNVLKSAKTGSWGQAWGKRLNRAVHEVEVRTADIEGSDAAGTIKMTLGIRLNFNGDALGQEAMGGFLNVPATITIKANAAGGKVSGTYELTPDALPPLKEKDPERRTPLQQSKGTVNGTLRKLDIAPQADPEHWALRQKESLEDLYVLGWSLETVADAWYQRIRAIDMTRRHGLGIAEANRNAQTPRMERPKLKLTAGKASDDGTGSTPPTALSAGDTDDLLESGAGAKPKTGKGKGKSSGAGDAVSDAAKAADLVEEMVRRAARMVDLVTKWESSAGDPEFAVDTIACEDPDFGPWYGEGGLESTADKANRLPATAGDPGGQEWRFVPAWQALGPFPLTRATLVTPLLPDLVLEGQETCRAQVERLPDYTGDATMEWAQCPPPYSSGIPGCPRTNRKDRLFTRKRPQTANG